VIVFLDFDGVLHLWPLISLPDDCRDRRHSAFTHAEDTKAANK
jgi:hypothetical protein